MTIIFSFFLISSINFLRFIAKNEKTATNNRKWHLALGYGSAIYNSAMIVLEILDSFDDNNDVHGFIISFLLMTSMLVILEEIWVNHQIIKKISIQNLLEHWDNYYIYIGKWICIAVSVFLLYLEIDLWW